MIAVAGCSDDSATIGTGGLVKNNIVNENVAGLEV